MNKVYIIRYEERVSGEYVSNVSYAFDTLEKAKNMLNEILKEELDFCKENDLQPSVYERDYNFILDYSDNYTKYEIVERNIL